MCPQDEEGFAETGEREDRCDRHDPPIGRAKTAQLITMQRHADAALFLRSLRLLHGKDDQADGQERRNDGDPEYCLKMIRRQPH